MNLPTLPLLSPKQLYVLAHPGCRLNILHGSVRSGKTHVSVLKWIRFILCAPAGDLVMLGKTYGTLVRNIIIPMNQFIGPDMVFYSSLNKISLWGRTIYCYGAGSKDAAGVLQGMTSAGAYGDEVTLWPREVFDMMLSRLSVEGAQFWGTTNPDAPKHFLKKDYLDREGHLDLKSFHFELDDNIYLPASYVRELKKEYTGLWYKRYILGLWAIAEGAIYDFYEDKYPYVIPRSAYPEAQYYVVGIDYGTQNPFVAGLYGVNRKSRVKIWKEAEYWYCGRDSGRQKTDGEYCDELERWMSEVVPKGKRIRQIYPDPSARSFITLLKQKGWPVKDNLNNAVLDGIRNQARMLKSGIYAIGEECQHTRDEYSAFVWDEKAQARGEDVPVKENDHTKDEERYVLMEEFGGDYLNYEALTRM